MFRVKHVIMPLDKEYEEQLGKIKNYDCDLCDSGGWQSETEVHLHRRHYHKKILLDVAQKDNACTTCGIELEDEDAVLRHIKSVHFYSSEAARRIERETYICDYCHNMFFNKDLLVLHIIHKHRASVKMKSFACPLCPYTRLKKGLVYKHMTNKHKFQSITICPICMSKRLDLKELMKHTSTHHKHYHCSVCGFMATREKDFNHHLERYRTREESPVNNYSNYFLPMKGKPRYRSLYSYVRIRPPIHGVVIPQNIYICILCREICKEDEMRTHVARDHATPSAVVKIPSVCSCGEVFSTGILLKHHMFKLKGDHRALSREEILQEKFDALEGRSGEKEKEDIINETEGDSDVEYHIEIVRNEDEDDICNDEPASDTFEKYVVNVECSNGSETEG